LAFFRISRDSRNALLLAIVVLTLFADVVFLGNGFYKGDTTAYHVPMKRVVRDMTFAGGFPEWNPRDHAGQPLAANPAYELWYPPQWLIYLPDFLWGFQFHILIHIVIAAIGMYALLRSLDLGEIAAALGALTFALGGPYLSLLLRLPFLFSMTWMPLILLFARRTILRPNRRDFAITAMLVGMQALIGEPVTFLQTGLLVGAYAIHRGFQAPARERARTVVRVLSIAGLALAAGVLMATVQLIPGLDHGRDSVRSEGFQWPVASSWSTPSSRLFEVAYPRVYRAFVGVDGNQAIHTMYPFRIEPFISDVYVGALAIILAVAGMFAGVRGRGAVFLLVAGFVILAMGDGTPVFRLLYDAKIFASIRYPEKFLIGALLVLIIWAAAVLDRLMAGDKKVRRAAATMTFLWLVIAVLTWYGGTRPPAPTSTDHVPVPWLQYWALNFVRAIAVWLLIRFAATPRRRLWAAALFAFVILDFAWLHQSVAGRAPRRFFDEPEVAHKLPPDREAYRLFHAAFWDEWAGAPQLAEFFRKGRPDWLFRDGMYPFRPAAFGFRSVLEDDLDQTGLMTSTRYLRAAQMTRRMTGVWSSFFLDAANVEQVIEFTNGAIVTRATGSHPRYYFASRVVAIQDDDDVVQNVLAGSVREGDAFTSLPAFDISPARVIGVSERPSRVTLNVEAAGDALLVASITAHRYWRATIDGRPAAIYPVNIAFQGVRVVRGRHVVELRYHNPLILPCALISAAVLAAMVAMAVAPRRSREPIAPVAQPAIATGRARDTRAARGKKTPKIPH